MSLTDEADELKDTESFELDGLDTYQLSDSALETLLRNGDMDQWLQTRLASGLVMPGDLGKMQIASELAKAENIAEAVKSLTGDEVAERQLLQVSLGNLSLSGEIRMFGDKFIAPQIGELRQRQLIDIWIRHLALCANGYSEASFIVSRSKYKKNGVYPATSQQLKPVPADKAVEQLQMLAGHYDQGLVEPLPFMPEASRAFFDTYKDSDDYDQAIEKAISNYASDQPGSEGSDRHYARLFNFPDVFDDFFAHLATDIYTPITKYLDKVDI